MKIRTWLGRRLRQLADRIDDDNAPRMLNLSFTFEHLEGVRVRTDRRGCPLSYLSESDYQRAHDESDTAHLQVDWRTMEARTVGGRLT